MKSKTPQDSTNTSDISIVKLFSYFINLSGLDKPQREFVPLFANELLESSRAHASYQFLLSEKESGDPRLLLWLLSGSIDIGKLDRSDTRVSRISFDRGKATCTFSMTCTQHDRALIIALKILYIPISTKETGNKPDCESTIQQWKNNPKVEKWVFESSCIHQLVYALEGHRRQLPESKQKMKSFYVSFLKNF